MKASRPMTVAQAVRAVQAEFPDVTASSLRFLEQEGLLRPSRTPGGHRLYGGEDVSRIRLIKRLQSKRRYSLDEIRHMLVKLERATDVEAEMDFLETLYAPVRYDPGFIPLNRQQLATASGLATSDVDRLTETGLLVSESNGGSQRRYDEDDLQIARLVAREVGLGARPDDFAAYASAMHSLVEAEVKLFVRLVGDRSPTSERARELKETADLVHTLLRAKLTRQLLLQARRNESSP